MSAQVIEFAGFVDVHVHFREPGMTEAETNNSGIAAAKHGGFAAVVAMPNTNPAGDSVDWVRNLHSLSDRDLCIFPSACITKGRLGKVVSDIEALAVAGAAFFTDDGNYVESDRVMAEAMSRTADLNMVICEHALANNDGVMRDCSLARRLNLPIIAEDAEANAIARDLAICRDTGCRLHIQHISTAKGVELVRNAQYEGLPITAEATPHHLLLTCDDLTADDANFKMSPPLGTREDRAELRKAVKDGVLMFATDHAPHPSSRKNLGFLKSANGITGLEAAIPISYGVMVEEEGMPIEDWARAWNEMPRFIVTGMPKAGNISDSLRKTKVVIGAEYKEFRIEESLSLSKNCPYAGTKWRCWPYGY